MINTLPSMSMSDHEIEAAIEAINAVYDGLSLVSALEQSKAEAEAEAKAKAQAKAKADAGVGASVDCSQDGAIAAMAHMAELSLLTDERMARRLGKEYQDEFEAEQRERRSRCSYSDSDK